MANKARGIFFLFLFVFFIALFAWQVDNYIKEEEERKIYEQKMASAEQHWRNSINDFNRAVDAFNQR